MHREDRRVELRFFGSARLLDKVGRRLALPKTAFVLALRLALSNPDAALSRTEAANFLWPDSPDAAANLRQLLVRLKAKQGDSNLFGFDNHRVWLRLENVDCDVAEFQQRAGSLDLAGAERLLDLFATGLFAPAANLAESAAEWVALQASRFRDRLVGSICDLLESPSAPPSDTAAQKVATRLLQVEPHEERAWRALMRSHAANGQFRQFDRAYRECRTLLHHDLNIAPSEATRELYQRHRAPAQAAGADAQAAGGRQDERAPAGSIAAGGVPRLVILPPVPGTAGGPHSTLASMLLEDVVVGLCYLKSVSVVAPYSSWKLHQRLEEEQAAIERLGIDYVVQATLFRIANGIQLSLRLFDSGTRSIRWAERFSFSEHDAEQCHRQTVSGIVRVLADAVDRAELGRHENSRNPTAYFWHLIGQKHLRALDLPAVRRASKAFRASIAADPLFAPARSGQARTLQREWLLLGRGEGGLLDAAQACGKRATELDDLDGRGFRELGIVNLYKRRFDEALACYAQAETLSPQHADTIADFADALAHSGKPEAGLKKMERAFELNPLPPDQYWWDLAGMYFQLGRFGEAIDAVGRMADPTSALRVAAASWAMIGEAAKAEACRLQFLETYPDFRIEDWLLHVPNRNKEFTAQYVEGLRAAGFN